MDDAQQRYPLALGPPFVDQKVLIDREASDRWPQFRSRRTHSREVREKLQRLVKLFDQPIRSFNAVLGNVVPDLKDVHFRRAGSDDATHLQPLLLLPLLPRSLRRFAARSRRPSAFIASTSH